MSANPIAEHMSLVSDALLLGFGDHAMFDRPDVVSGMELVYFAPTETLYGGAVLQLTNVSTGLVVQYNFSPPTDKPNPMQVVSLEDGSSPVQTRLILEAPEGSREIPLKKRDGSLVFARLVQIDVIDDGAVFSADNTTGVGPFGAEFDSLAYRVIASKAYTEGRLQDLVSAVTEFGV